MTQSDQSTSPRPSLEVLFHEADELIAFHAGGGGDTLGAKPCQCAQAAIDRGYLELDPDCKANGCKELRR